MDDIRQSNDVPDVVTQYLIGIIRKHLHAVRYEEPTTPPLAAQRTEQTILLINIIVYEKRNETILACLLKAARSVRQDAIGNEAAVIDEFLQRYIQRCLQQNIKTSSASSGGILFLLSVLEEMMRREELDEDEGKDDDADVKEPAEDVPLENGCCSIEDGITVSIGNASMLVDFEDILACFWTSSQLDTCCLSCNKPFDDEPPIRTISKGHEPHATSTIHVRVSNRHFSCAQTSGFFVPVSHVWDHSIRMANKLQVHNHAAASTLIGTLKALFQSSENAYGPGVEFWHDYFSVPQWHAELKDALLLRLPAIYHSADEILVHLADVTSSYISLLLKGGVDDGNDDAVVEVIKKIPLMRAVCSSRWMERMWVSLEYSQCRAASVMDKHNKIWRVADYDVQGGQIVDLCARDSFSNLIVSAQRHMLELMPYAMSFAISLFSQGEFLAKMPGKGHGKPTATEARQLCLGTAIERIINKKCEFPRDRLFAVHMLLNANSTTWSTTDTTRIPQSEAETYAWVWREALARGDYSPLLLQPRESVMGSNPAVQLGFASWSVGWAGLEAGAWNCGYQVSPPLWPLIIDEVAIHVDLDLVGEIEKIHYLDVKDSGWLAGVDWAIGILGKMARANGAVLSAERVVDGLSRVFPIEIMYEERARRIANLVFSFEEHQERNKEFQNRMQMLLDQLSKTDMRKRDRKPIVQQISDLLGFKVIVPFEKIELTRLGRSEAIAVGRSQRGAHNGEPICEVKCPGCDRVTPFRLDLRDTANVGQRVYRIPGLSYSQSVEGGVGLVIDEGRITGRMLYGQPACTCRLSESVKID